MRLKMSLQNKIKDLMFKRNITVGQLAKLSGVSYHAIYRFFNDEYNPRLSNLEKLSKCLGCKLIIEFVEE